MISFLKNNRIRMDQDLRNAGKGSFSSPAVCRADRDIHAAITRHATGAFMDAGCGTLPYMTQILPLVQTYDTLDIEKRDPRVKYVGDIQNLEAFQKETYDTVISFSVLEHLPDPFAAVSELTRILKPQGKLIITVPHLSRLHEVPHDYFRFTRYGIQALFKSQPVKILELKPVGGLFCFLGHQVSIVLLSLVWHLPVIRTAALWLNRLLIVEPAIFIDRILDKNKLFAMDYLCVAQKI